MGGATLIRLDQGLAGAVVELLEEYGDGDVREILVDFVNLEFLCIQM